MALIICLVLCWIYGISVAAAFVQQGDGIATQWLLFFVIFTIPSMALLLLVHRALRKLTREFDYCIAEDDLLIYNCYSSKRKLLLQINCFAITAFAPALEAGEAEG